ncbi:hypothetical protein C1O66_04085 [Paucibacter aquatile]|uniref:Uncharacterized protein n=1 Tax=Kinneretia aquatilis TaxID=2070761 RepID=A0A2N8KTM3_9BURK|nr:hypothetical protein [Paucibacter aquatile]PND36796.1 hypothetical protein C1O66_04085 [Paucibacter aquatile]
MPLTITRASDPARGQYSLEIEEIDPVTPASRLLWHIAQLPGVTVLAKKSWALTDDFEAYFTYKGQMFCLQTPFVNACLVMRAPGDPLIFQELEDHISQYRVPSTLVSMLAMLRFFVLPSNPKPELWPH